MIISHTHKFIFVKTMKTAGTSVEIALSHLCGERDVLTPIAPVDEAARRSAGARGAQNYRLPVGSYRRQEWLQLATRRSRPRFVNHQGASFIRDHVDSDVWNTYFKFCFERNPWDKVISYYFWRHPQQPRPPLTEFIQSGQANSIKGFELYTINAEIAMDQVCRFESLSGDLQDVARVLGLPAFRELPRAKA